METRTFQTAFGEIALSGRDTGKPLFFVLPGLFTDERSGFDLQAAWPAADVLVGRVPGDGAPAFASPSIGVFGAAYSEALAMGFPARPIFIYGLSTGALIALALRGPIQGMFLVEPPLRTHDLWSLREALRQAGPNGWEKLAWPLFGIDDERHEGRDYMPALAALSVPATVLAGGIPLMPRRPVPDQPSLVDECARAALRAHLMVRFVEIPNAGHSIVGRGIHAIDRLLWDAHVAATRPRDATASVE